MRKWIFAVLLLALLAAPACAATIDFSTSCKSNIGYCNDVYAAGVSFMDTLGNKYNFPLHDHSLKIKEKGYMGHAKVIITLDHPIEILDGSVRYHYYVHRSWGFFNCFSRWDRMSVPAKVIEISSKHRACDTDIITFTLIDGRKVVVDSGGKRGTYGMWNLY